LLWEEEVVAECKYYDGICVRRPRRPSAGLRSLTAAATCISVRRRKDNIKTNLGEIVWGASLIRLSQDRGLVNTLMSCRAS
jgi:hypothetical protein